MSTMGSRNSSSHSRRSDSGSNRETAGSSASFNSYNNRDEPPPPEDQGIEVVPKSRNYLSTSHAGVMRRTDGSDSEGLTMSQHAREDLEVVPEAAGHLERGSLNLGTRSQPPGNLRNIPYEDYSEEFIIDGSLRMDGSTRTERLASTERTDRTDRTDRLERSERSDRMEARVDRSGELSRQDSVSRGPSSMSVVSDVSYGDKPYHSMPVISLAQDSGSILPHLNTSHKSACSMTHGSKRLAEKRASLLRSGSILYCEDTSEKKKLEDMDLEFTRWGGRKDYSQRENDKKRKAALHKIHKRKVKAEKRKSLEEQESFRSVEPKGHGFHDLWGFAFRQDHLEYEQLIKEDKDRELVASYCEEPFWKIIFHFKGTVLRVIIEDILFWLTLAVGNIIGTLPYGDTMQMLSAIFSPQVPL